MRRGRYLVFLNYDCEPEPGWLDALVRCADDDPGVGAAQAVVLHPDGTVNTAGNRLHYLGFSWAPNGGSPPVGAPVEIAVGSGACLLVPAQLFQELGGFWESMFLYCEDTDLCWRIRLAGLRVLVCPEARSITTTTSAAMPPSSSTSSATACSCSQPTTSAGTLPRLAPALVATEVALLGVALRGGWLPQKLRSLASAARAMPAVREQRRAVAHLRRIPDGAFSTSSSDGSGPSSARALRMRAPTYSRHTPASSGCASRGGAESGAVPRAPATGAASHATASASVRSGFNSLASSRPARACAARASASPSRRRPLARRPPDHRPPLTSPHPPERRALPARHPRCRRSARPS